MTTACHALLLPFLQGSITEKPNLEKAMTEGWSAGSLTGTEALPVAIMPAVERMLLVHLLHYVLLTCFTLSVLS